MIVPPEVVRDVAVDLRPRYDHLLRLSHRLGVWEHTELERPRREHGSCTDDVARALIVAVRGASSDPRLVPAAGNYLRCVLEARIPRGGFHNRRDADGRWCDRVGSDDSQGRALWALGVAARAAPRTWMRQQALPAFESLVTFDSPHLRANAFAALGAAEVLVAAPTHRWAGALLRRCAERLQASRWSPWPEDRLTYDNARLAEALLAAGAVLGDAGLTRRGLRMLEWLVAVETVDGHFSFTPVGGREVGPACGPRSPAFDQQPVEAAAMADACIRAWVLTRAPAWREQALRAAAWLTGRNDTGALLYDAATGATFDGLQAVGVNLNRGAESTISGLFVLQAVAGATRRGAEAG